MDKSKIALLFGEATHEMWSHWMKYLFTQGWNMPDGKFSIKRDKVERWKRQMETSFLELTEEEQNSDIKVFLNFMEKPIKYFSETIIDEIKKEILNEVEKKSD